MEQSPIRPQIRAPIDAPVWTPRNEAGYFVVTCPLCLRSFSVPDKKGPEVREIECIFCESPVRYLAETGASKKQPRHALKYGNLAFQYRVVSKSRCSSPPHESETESSKSSAEAATNSEEPPVCCWHPRLTTLVKSSTSHTAGIVPRRSVPRFLLNFRWSSDWKQSLAKSD